MKNTTIINIGRQYGSGGRLIGEKLAEKLQFAFYDKELINLASKESGLGKEFFEQADERKSYGLFGSFLGLRSNVVGGNFPNNCLSGEELFRIQSDVIKNLAEQQPCIFVGRCADYILRENPRCLNIFVTASMSDRIRRVLNRNEAEKTSENAVIDLIEKVDKKRADYYNYFSNKTWGAASSYHLCINSSFLGVDDAVKLIENIIH
ncbi:MAG: cytidylate kinase-like family protein [Prevotellaceae bacterium]|jgi:cytidylate kinase|nr:cytidylate kinase-like family protein [Prevotellaceae bacterium]